MKSQVHAMATAEVHFSAKTHVLMTPEAVVLGIVSFGVRGCYSDQHYPEVYTNVFEYVDWIVNNAQ